jgi:hypothetical protein
LGALVGPRHEVDPSVCARDDDFWGSIALVVLYAASHGNDNGHVR